MKETRRVESLREILKETPAIDDHYLWRESKR